MGAIEDIKAVSELIRKYNDIELNRRIVALENEVLDLSRDKRRAEERIEELERALRFNKELTLRDGLYWLEGDSAPFCTRCFDAEKKAIRLKRLPFVEKGHRLQCPNCKTFYVRPQGTVI